MRDELFSRKRQIIVGFTEIKGLSVEACFDSEDEAYSAFDFDGYCGIVSGYEFEIADGIFRSNYFEEGV